METIGRSTCCIYHDTTGFETWQKNHKIEICPEEADGNTRIIFLKNHKT